jgi:Flp pilus assembly pilin Flp
LRALNRTHLFNEVNKLKLKEKVETMLKLIVKAKTFMHSMKEENGQDLIEYVLLGALIAVACVTAIGNVATKINTELAAIVSAL